MGQVAPDTAPIRRDGDRVLMFAVSLALLWLLVCLVRDVRSDGYGRRPPPRSHPDEEMRRYDMTIWPGIGPGPRGQRR